MLKFGISSSKRLKINQLIPGKQVSAAILVDFLQDNKDIYGVLGDEIKRKLILPNSTGKTTWQGRFDDFNQKVLNLLNEKKIE